MTKKEAYETVRNTFDDDNISNDEQREIFAAIYGRDPEEDEVGLEWSLACAATPGLCGCSTRSEHEQGACGTQISIWDDAVGVECAINADGDFVVISSGGTPVEDIITPVRNFSDPQKTANATLAKWLREYDGDPDALNLRVEVKRDGRTAVAYA